VRIADWVALQEAQKVKSEWQRWLLGPRSSNWNELGAFASDNLCLANLDISLERS
jgi:hypothetical protein